MECSAFFVINDIIEFLMKKSFKRLHLWLAMPFGIIISLICFTGAMQIFEREITELIRYDRYHVKEVKTQKLPLAELIDRVVPELKDSVSIIGITVSKNPSRPYRVNLSQPRKSGMMIDQYTGEVLGMDQRMPFFMTMFKLHRWLLCERPDNETDVWWGKLIVGMSTIMFVFVIVSGLIVWWPKTVRGLRKRMRIHVGQGLKRFFFDFHTIGGACASIFLLIMALTGLTWSFDWYRDGFYRIFGVKSEAKKVAAKDNEKNKEEKPFAVIPANYSVWQRVYDEVYHRQPDATSISIDEEEAIATFGSLGNGRASNTYNYDAETGNVSGVEFYTEAKPKLKVKGWVYSVHTGSWGGYLTKVLQFLAALLGALLPITGYYLWIKRSMNKSRR